MARGAADGSRTRDPQIGSLMLCQLSYRRIYRNEDGGEVFRSFLAPITLPIHIISQFPPKEVDTRGNRWYIAFRRRICAPARGAGTILRA